MKGCFILEGFISPSTSCCSFLISMGKGQGGMVKKDKKKKKKERDWDEELLVVSIFGAGASSLCNVQMKQRIKH